MGLTAYLSSPLQTFELGRWVQCMNEECALLNKTVFKLVRITQQVEHETHTWVCSLCRTKGVKKVAPGSV